MYDADLQYELRALPLREIIRFDREMDAASRRSGMRLKPGISSPDGVVVTGVDGYLYIGDGANHWERQFLGKLRPRRSWADEWLLLLERRRVEAERRNVRLLNVVVPEKQVVLPEYRWQTGLPSPRARPIEILLNKLRSPADLLYLGEALIAAKKEAPVFSRLDSHWTPSGCCVAALRIAQELGAEIATSELLFGYHPASTIHDLPRHMFDDIERTDAGRIVPIKGYASREDSTKPNTGRRCTIVNPEAPDARRVIIFGDSFSYWAGLAPALSRLFTHIAFIWSKDVLWDDVLAERADVVMWEHAERFLITVPDS